MIATACFQRRVAIVLRLILFESHWELAVCVCLRVCVRVCNGTTLLEELEIALIVDKSTETEEVVNDDVAFSVTSLGLYKSWPLS